MAVWFTDGPFRTPIWGLDSRPEGSRTENGHLQLPYYPGSMRARPRQLTRSLSPRRPPRAATSQLQSDQQPRSPLPHFSVQCLNMAFYYVIYYVIDRPPIWFAITMTYDILHGYSAVEDHHDIDVLYIDRQKDSVMRATLSTPA